jgi:folate-binding protein YgfZ
MNPLLEFHQKSDLAEFGRFGEIDIVSTFGEPQAEYSAVHKSCGLVDMPFRGVIDVTGRDRHEFLGNLLTARTWDKASRRGIEPGFGVASFFLNLKGRVVADMNLIERGDRLLIETDARLVDLLCQTFDKYRFSEQVGLSPRHDLHRIGLLGPGAAGILYDAAGVDVASIVPLASVEATLFGTPATMFRDDWSTAAGFQIVVESNSSLRVWNGLVDAFADEGRESNKRRLRRIGWAALNATRIEAGRPVLGIDFEPAAPSTPGRPRSDVPESPASRGILPAETGLFDRSVDVNKGCYLGQEIVARMYSRGQVARKIVGFRMDADALPLAGAAVADDAGTQVGIVTSSTVSPVLSNACIGLMLVNKPWFEIGSAVRVAAEGSIQPARVVTTPFI